MITLWPGSAPFRSGRPPHGNTLDELHLPPPQPEHDKNIYTFGSISGHNIVIVYQGDMGTTAAAVVATRMDDTFRGLRFGLLVGIVGGVPDRKDVRPSVNFYILIPSSHPTRIL